MVANREMGCLLLFVSKALRGRKADAFVRHFLDEFSCFHAYYPCLGRKRRHHALKLRYVLGYEGGEILNSGTLSGHLNPECIIMFPP